MKRVNPSKQAYYFKVQEFCILFELEANNLIYVSLADQGYLRTDSEKFLAAVKRCYLDNISKSINKDIHKIL